MPSDSPHSHPAALTVTNLVKSYNGKKVVDELNFYAPSGAITAVLGPNGAGKTTTIECCEGLRTADSGQILVLNRPPEDPSLRHEVGVMLQDGGLPTAVKAGEMLKHVAAMYNDPIPPSELIDRLGLDSFVNTTVRRLSGGQRQRLALAAALIGRPQLVFLDEPSAGMDPQSRHAVWQLIAELRDQGVSFVLTTHLMDEAESLADHVVIVDHGKVIASGTVSELTSTTRDQSNTAINMVQWTTTPGLPTTDLLDQWRDLTEASSGTDSPASMWTVDEVSAGRYRAIGPADSRHVHDITRWAHRHNALITSLSVNQRSLEDVFLELTGRQLR